jgi:dihydroorotase
VHHLLFSDLDYPRLGNLIKCNPSIKTAEDIAGIWKAISEGHIDAVTTDHAPHLLSEKNQGYWKAPAGIPFVQHGLAMMLRWVQDGKWALTDVVRLMAHAPAALYGVANRGFLEEGNWADIVLLGKNSETVGTENVLSKCAWSPLEGETFTWLPSQVWVSGHRAMAEGKFNFSPGQRLLFSR